MATLTVQPGFSVNVLLFGNNSYLFSGEPFFYDFEIEFVWDFNDFAVAYGAYFYDFFDNLIGGSIYSLEEYLDGFLAYQVTGLNLEVFTTLNYIDTFNPTGLLTYALQGNDLLFGNFSDDVISGFDGNDAVYGGAGDDTVAGAFGADALYGGAGFDVFFLVGPPVTSNADLIADYDDAFDRIWLDAAWYGLPLGTLADKYFHVGKKAHDKNDRIIYDKKHGELLYDSNGKKGGGEELIALIGKKIKGLDADDFFVT